MTEESAEYIPCQECDTLGKVGDMSVYGDGTYCHNCAVKRGFWTSRESELEAKVAELQRQNDALAQTNQLLTGLSNPIFVTFDDTVLEDPFVKLPVKLPESYMRKSINK